MNEEQSKSFLTMVSRACNAFDEIRSASNYVDGELDAIANNTLQIQACLERIAITQELNVLAKILEGLPSNPRFPSIAEKNTFYLNTELHKRIHKLFPGLEKEPIETL